MKESEERKPWGFCETPEAKCRMNYCDENGCQNRKRTYAPLKSESEDISARAEESFVILLKSVIKKVQ